MKIKMLIHAAGYFPSQHWFTATKVACDFPDEIVDCIFYAVSACPAAVSDNPKTSIPASCNVDARNLSTVKYGLAR